MRIANTAIVITAIYAGSSLTSASIIAFANVTHSSNEIKVFFIIAFVPRFRRVCYCKTFGAAAKASRRLHSLKLVEILEMKDRAVRGDCEVVMGIGPGTFYLLQENSTTALLELFSAITSIPFV